MTAAGYMSDTFDDLLSQYATRTYGLVHRFVGADAAEDVTQEVWIAVYRALPRFRGEAKISTWLFSIAARVCQRHHRRRPKLTVVEETAADEVPDESSGPEQDALRGELAVIVREAIDVLPPGQREVVHLRQLEGCSYQEIASILGIPIGTVRSRLHHGMAKLADLLDPYLES
jgi:RNA polymerase sigma-70 factor (ECF subfamily)